MKLKDRVRHRKVIDGDERQGGGQDIDAQIDVGRNAQGQKQLCHRARGNGIGDPKAVQTTEQTPEDSSHPVDIEPAGQHLHQGRHRPGQDGIVRTRPDEHIAELPEGLGERVLYPVSEYGQPVQNQQVPFGDPDYSDRKSVV